MGKTVASLQLLVGWCNTSSDTKDGTYKMKKYGYHELATATDFFNGNHLLGEGGFGQVFKGKLDGEVVAIKKLKIIKLDKKWEESEFLSRVRHPNIVKMIGHCSEGKNRLLVLEFVPNKTLTYHLHGHGRKKKILKWSKRMKIALQSAKGLLYLHESCIIHRDIKADNILLDSNFEPKVADFSLANFLPNTDGVTHITTMIKGTSVYADPEYGDVQKLSEKSDIYSFGVILLELITGRKILIQDISIVEWAKDWIRQALNNNDYTNLVDSKLKDSYDKEEMRRMIYCAYTSVYKSSQFRPKMKQIVEVLEGSMLPEKLMDGNDGSVALRDDIPQIHKLKEYNYRELAIATDYFSNDRLLGESGFSQVFKGTLDGEDVAIKMLKRKLENKLEEIEFLGFVRHRNIVKMIGYCSEGKNRMLVLEYVPNNTLAYHLHGTKTILDWSKRMKIAIHSAKGLLYLHEDCKPKIIHQDIKSDNILLDYNFKPKVAGFSLANFLPDIDDVTHITSLLRGTNVYVDPEYDNIQKISEKSDVYSFGVVLLELITGRRPIDEQGNSIINWAKDRIGQALNNNDYVGLVDSKLGELYDKEEIRKMICCAAVSIYKPALFRPRMKEIVEALEGSMPLKSIGLNSTSISHLSSFTKASSSSTLYQRKTWDVFISSRGNDDVRKGFLSHLLNALQQKSINTFVDNTLREGKEISLALLKIIEESSVAVVILSENYADSAWCMEELVKILECKQTLGQIVLPVFYGVDQSDVRKLRGSFEEVVGLTENLKDSLHKADRWSLALREISNLSGWDSRDIKPDSKLIEEIVNDICKKLSHVLPSDSHNDNLEIYPTEESTSSADEDD